MVNSSTIRMALLTISLAILGLVAGATVWRIYSANHAPVLSNLIEYPEPRAIADFALTDHQSRPFSLKDFKGHWSLLFFGFTSCPDICPNTLYQLQQAVRLMAQQGDQTDVPRVYLISVDPERDTPQKLAEYLAFFDPGFIGLSGDDAQLNALSMQLGVIYHVQPHEPGSEAYDVDHSANLLLLNPEAQLYGVLRAPHQAQHIADDLLKVIH